MKTLNQSPIKLAIKIFFIMIVLIQMPKSFSQTLGYEFPIQLNEYSKSNFVTKWQIVEKNDTNTDTFFCYYIKKGDTLLLVYPDKYISLDLSNHSLIADFENKELTVLKSVEIDYEENVDAGDVDFGILDTLNKIAINDNDELTKSGSSDIQFTKDSVSNIPLMFNFIYKDNGEENGNEEAINVNLNYTRQSYIIENDAIDGALNTWWPVAADGNVQCKFGTGWTIIKF